MRAVVLLCLLHAAFGKHDGKKYSWTGPDHEMLWPVDSSQNHKCESNMLPCGCCLMQQQMWRMEEFFNYTLEAMKTELTIAKRTLNDTVSRSAFSVALSLDQDCFGPFNDSRIIIYKHAFFILGGSYSLSTGIFTVTRSGVYSLSVTIYGAHVSGETMLACANLEVNGKGVSSLLESNGQDLEDSATVVLAVNLTAGDEVAVILPKDCVLCDHNNYNTFTGFLLYTTA
ncbi:complement C1q-like protein 2 [Labrus bergylta]|uniref:complement C1q-like protein 2 n=1 Tax=Labrus bergylta TaxID=56723 RepID=UPI0033133678